MKAFVRRATCICFAQCVEEAPEVFSLDEECKSVASDIRAAHAGVVVRAAQACPTQSIEVWDDLGVLVYPEKKSSTPTDRD